MTKNLPEIALGIALSVSSIVGCDDGEEATAPTPASATEPSPGEGQQTTAHRVEVTVNPGGYEPSEVAARAGEPLTLVFTRTSDEGCGHEVVIADADIERELPLNQPVEVTFTPREAGELRFSCGMDMYDGKIVVR
jgi:plastocyanin domain-containing protein